MLRDFLEETILTGRIRDKFLKDIPNSIILQNVNNYRLSIQSKDFIMKYSIKNPLLSFDSHSQIKSVNLPIRTNSTNFHINWGDNYSIEVYELNYVSNIINQEIITPGSYTYDMSLNLINVYYNKDAYVSYYCDNISNFHDNVVNSSFIIRKYENNIYDFPIVIDNVLLQNYTSHQYKEQGQYYIKIGGGFTGFSGPTTQTYLKNNPFNLIEASYSKLMNKNIILIQSNDHLISGIDGQYHKNNDVYIKMTNNQKGLIFQDNILKYREKLNDQNTTRSLHINKIALDMGEICVDDTATISASYSIPNLEFNSLLEILSWGSCVNWETLNGAFYGASKLMSLPQEKLPNVNDFTSAFCYCKDLKSLNNYTNIFPNAMISADYMFAYSGLEENLINYKFPPNLVCIESMFAYTNITSLPYGWDDREYFRCENIALSTNI